MKKKLIALSLVLAALSACASAPSDTAVPTSAPMPTPTATPTPAATPVLTPSPQPSEEPTPVPTMVSYEPVSVDSWLANANCRMPDCSISAPADGKPRLNKMVAWPEEGVTLCCTCQTLEEAAEAFDTTVDELKALNPDWEENFARNGYFYQLKIQAEPYILPQNDVVWVKVDAPWAECGYKTVYEVPASLDRQAAASNTASLSDFLTAYSYFNSEKTSPTLISFVYFSIYQSIERKIVVMSSSSSESIPHSNSSLHASINSAACMSLIFKRICCLYSLYLSIFPNL